MVYTFCLLGKLSGLRLKGLGSPFFQDMKGSVHNDVVGVNYSSLENAGASGSVRKYALPVLRPLMPSLLHFTSTLQAQRFTCVQNNKLEPPMLLIEHAAETLNPNPKPQKNPKLNLKP